MAKGRAARVPRSRARKCPNAELGYLYTQCRSSANHVSLKRRVSVYPVGEISYLMPRHDRISDQQLGGSCAPQDHAPPWSSPRGGHRGRSQDRRRAQLQGCRRTRRVPRVRPVGGVTASPLARAFPAPVSGRSVQLKGPDPPRTVTTVVVDVLLVRPVPFREADLKQQPSDLPRIGLALRVNFATRSHPGDDVVVESDLEHLAIEAQLQILTPRSPIPEIVHSLARHVARATNRSNHPLHRCYRLTSGPSN
jgi:hypothetical protein